MEITYKKVDVEDIPLVYKLYCKLEKREATINEINRAIEIYKELLDRGNYTFAAYDKDKVIGSVNVYKNMQYYPLNQNEPYVHLECVVIAEEYQGKGIGSTMIEKVVMQVITEGCTYIIGQSKNPAMQRVWEKAGLTNTSYKDFRKEMF